MKKEGSFLFNKNVVVIFLKFDKEIKLVDFKEYFSLIYSYNFNILDVFFLKINLLVSSTLINNNNILNLKKALEKLSSFNFILLNFNLTPIQKVNLEKLFNIEFIDYSLLILKIFHSRAITYEGKLQVKLAELKYLYGRLIGKWDHLERQKGGIGLRGGPGERQIEIDRRLIYNKIKHTELIVGKVKKQREQNRVNRVKNKIPVVSLVGYTNVGKSSLFNILTSSNIVVDNAMFTTLDPVVRTYILKYFGKVIFVDTVGFLNNLPKNIFYAFKVTLEEILSSNLLLHVIDLSDKDYKRKEISVLNILKSIGILNIPIINVYNKCDILNIKCVDDFTFPYAKISVKQNYGIDNLLDLIRKNLIKDIFFKRIVLNSSDLKFRSKLYEIGCVDKEIIDNNGNYILDLIIDKDKYCSIFKNYTGCV